MMVRIVYFAWVREKIGKSEEDIELPATVTTASELIQHLTALGEEYEAAFAFPDVIRVAVNQEHVEHDESIAGAREIGIFPPMTGG
jgi:molybdopterin synthase sulfur carrier subunit